MAPLPAAGRRVVWAFVVLLVGQAMFWTGVLTIDSHSSWLALQVTVFVAGHVISSVAIAVASPPKGGKAPS